MEFSEENPKFYSQAQTQAQNISIQDQPVISTRAQPLVSQTQTQLMTMI